MAAAGDEAGLAAVEVQVDETPAEEYLIWRVARRCQGIGLVGPAMGGEVWGFVLAYLDAEKVVVAEGVDPAVAALIGGRSG